MAVVLSDDEDRRADVVGRLSAGEALVTGAAVEVLSFTSLPTAAVDVVSVVVLC